MVYLKATLSAVGAIFLTCVVIFRIFFFKGFSEQKASTLGAFTLILHSVLFWIIVTVCFTVFFGLFLWFSRVGNRFVRVGLFWVPTVTLSTLGFTIAGLVAYLASQRHATP